jgi:hypothetical protein
MAAKNLAALQRLIFHKKLRNASNAGAGPQVVGRATLAGLRPPSRAPTRKSFSKFSNFRAQSATTEAAGIPVAQ